MPGRTTVGRGRLRRLLATVPERRDRRESAGEEVSPQGPGTRYACTGTSSPPGGRGTPEPGRHGARAVGCASPSECKPWERLCCPGGEKGSPRCNAHSEWSAV